MGCMVFKGREGAEGTSETARRVLLHGCRVVQVGVTCVMHLVLSVAPQPLNRRQHWAASCFEPQQPRWFEKPWVLSSPSPKKASCMLITSTRILHAVA